MSGRSVTHSSFSVERRYPAAPQRVFRAWSEPATKARWFTNPRAEVVPIPHELDFRVGGRERLSGGRRAGPIYRYEAIYYDIVPDSRLVYAYEMFADDRRISVSLATMEVHPDGSGTRLVYTEQGAFLDGLDKVEHREQGTRDLLDALEGLLTEAEVSA
jgi:uncharacterized protein YndB with AHSA1/START domain